MLPTKGVYGYMDFLHGLTVYACLFSLLMGFTSFMSPCILPLVPSYISYITGISYDELVNADSRRKNMKIAFFHSVIFVAGFSVIFVLLGATAFIVGCVLSQYLDILRIVGGIIVIVMGIFVMDVLNVPFLQQDARLHIKTRPAGFAGTFVVGMIFAAGWTPCTGPFLGSVLALATETNTMGRGMTLLTCYSIGLGIPFILSAIAISAFLSSFGRLKKHLKTVKIISGIILIAMGVLLITDKLTVLIPR